MNSHFITAYEAHVKKSLARFDTATAMESAIGGNFKPFGILQRDLLIQYGLSPTSTLVDLGCGSGRLANALKTFPQLAYTGIDIVDSLLDYARKLCRRTDWNFIKNTTLQIPLPSDAADMACAFSLFTHLLHEETYTYLQEVRRVLRPGGRIVFSFLDFSVPAHWTVFETNLANVNQMSHLNQFMDRGAIEVWSQRLGLEVVAIRPGYEMYIQLQEPVELEDKTVLTGEASLGQSLGVLQKPLS